MDKSDSHPRGCYDEYKERLQAQIRKGQRPLLNFDPLSQLPPWLEHPEKLSNEAIAYANRSPWYHIQLENARRDPASPLYSQRSSRVCHHAEIHRGESSEVQAEKHKRPSNAGYEGDDEEGYESEEWQSELLYASGSTSTGRGEETTHFEMSIISLNISEKEDKKVHTSSAELKQEKKKEGKKQESLYASWNPGEDEKKLPRSQNDEAIRYEMTRRKLKSSYPRIQRISKSQEEIADERIKDHSGK